MISQHILHEWLNGRHVAACIALLTRCCNLGVIIALSSTTAGNVRIYQRCVSLPFLSHRDTILAAATRIRHNCSCSVRRCQRQCLIKGSRATRSVDIVRHAIYHCTLPSAQGVRPSVQHRSRVRCWVSCDTDTCEAILGRVGTGRRDRDRPPFCCIFFMFCFLFFRWLLNPSSFL